MPESVREYANELLRESAEAKAFDEKQRDYFLALAEEASPMLYGAEQGEWLARLDAEYENLRLALFWSLQQQENGVAAALRLCAALQPFWVMRGYIEEGRQWCEAALQLARASN